MAPEISTKLMSPGRNAQPWSSTSRSVQQPQAPAAGPEAEAESSLAQAAGTGWCQRSPGTSSSRNVGRAVRPMASMGESWRSAPMTCFSTRSRAPKSIDATQRQVPKTKAPLDTNFPSTRATTVAAAQTTPRSMQSHSRRETFCALRYSAIWRTAVASGVHARMTWFTESGMKARLKLLRLMFRAKAAAKQMTYAHSRRPKYRPGFWALRAPATPLRTARSSRKRPRETTCCRPVTRKEAGTPCSPEATSSLPMRCFMYRFSPACEPT
mmetsp:Transcript_68241/g.206214  ORF Transcript_68241/g.206214 Transcript_68241/m.206214 type:complete len:268 (+) Transcript_68241:244-1047(+)